MRNQSVGRTCRSAASGPRLWIADLNQDVFRRFLGVLDEHVEVAILIEHARVEQFVLHLVPPAAVTGFDQIPVREGCLRILVEVLHVRMRRRAVEVEVILLDVLTVIALAVGQAEQAFLEDRVLAVPQGQREAESLLVVGNARQAILAPAIGAGASLIVAEVIPGVAPFAVVLAHRSPLALAEVRPPFLPRSFLLQSLVQSVMFSSHRVPQFDSKLRCNQQPASRRFLRELLAAHLRLTDLCIAIDSWPSFFQGILPSTPAATDQVPLKGHTNQRFIMSRGRALTLYQPSEGMADDGPRHFLSMARSKDYRRDREPPTDSSIDLHKSTKLISCCQPSSTSSLLGSNSKRLTPREGL